jgi:hypothetical protein
MAGIAKLTGIELSKYDVPSSDPDTDFLSEQALSSEDEIRKEKRKAAAAAMAKDALSKIGTKGKQAPGGFAQVAAAAVPKASTKWGLGAFKSSVMQSVRSTVGLPNADSPSDVKTFERQDTTDSEEDHRNKKFGVTSISRVRAIGHPCPPNRSPAAKGESTSLSVGPEVQLSCRSYTGCGTRVVG